MHSITQIVFYEMASRSDHRKAMRTCSRTGYHPPYPPRPDVIPLTDLVFFRRLKTVKSRKTFLPKAEQLISSFLSRTIPHHDLNYIMATEHCSFAQPVTKKRFQMHEPFSASPIPTHIS